MTLGYPPVLQACVAALLIATRGIVAHLVRIRRLVDVETALRLPPGARRPRLLFSLSHQT